MQKHQVPAKLSSFSLPRYCQRTRTPLVRARSHRGSRWWSRVRTPCYSVLLPTTARAWSARKGTVVGFDKTAAVRCPIGDECSGHGSRVTRKRQRWENCAWPAMLQNIAHTRYATTRTMDRRHLSDRARAGGLMCLQHLQHAKTSSQRLCWITCVRIFRMLIINTYNDFKTRLSSLTKGTDKHCGEHCEIKYSSACLNGETPQLVMPSGGCHV